MDRSGGYQGREFVAEFYDYVEPYRRRLDVDFYVGLAVESGGQVLELGCGTGRVLIPTARAGIRITGLDLSEPMMAICRRKLAQEPLEVQARVKLLSADIRDFDLGHRFRLITVPFRPFQHLIAVDEQLACLTCVHRHLESGGRFVVEMFNLDIRRLVDAGFRQEQGDEPLFEMPDGRRVVRKHRNAAVDLSTQVISAEIIYYVTYPDGRQERLVHAFPFRYFFRYEVEHLLARAGLEVEALYSDFDKRPYGAEGGRELIFVARKP